ncbi:MAG: PhzF family phenazine biosynthesis protein [Nocardioides sp.]
MRLAYDIVDVFTGRPFAGNQLAVVHGAGGLSSRQCQAIAHEFNFSETTFPVPRSDHDYDVRIFTPTTEIPFAGHPTLGTAWVLRSRGELAGLGVVTQHCTAGDIEVRFTGASAVELSAPPRDSVGHDGRFVSRLLADLGLFPSDLDGQVWLSGCGLTFAHVPVVDDALGRVHVPSRTLSEYDDQPVVNDPLDGVNVYAVTGGTGEDVLRVHARVFVQGLSVPEDPATGSAAAGLGIALVETGRLPAGGRYRIRQGLEMGRPSTLDGRVDVGADGRPVLCHVAGDVQVVAGGEIVVPA